MTNDWIERDDFDDNTVGQMAVTFERFSRFLHALADGGDPYEKHEYGDAVAAVDELRLIEDFLADHKPMLVALAKQEGASWTLIGEALGISRQAAQQRFGE